MKEAKTVGTSQGRSYSECELDDLGQEIPSSSQFYRFFNPVVEGGEGSRLSSPTEELHNSSFLVYQRGSKDIPNLCTLQTDVSDLLKECHQTTLQNRKENTNQNHDVALLADEYMKMKKVTKDNDRLINYSGVHLNMQDKELEAIIASIAELCDLNVTLIKDVREAKNYNSELVEKARKHRVEHLSYETGVMMLESENKELILDIKELEEDLESDKETKITGKANITETLRVQLERLRAEISLEEQRSNQLEQNLVSAKDEYRNGYLRENTVFSFEGVPSFGTDKIAKCLQDAVNITKETKPIYSLNAYSKLFPIPGSRSVSATPRPENIPQHLNILESRPPTSTGISACYRNVHKNLDDNVVCNDLSNLIASFNAIDSGKSVDRSQALSPNTSHQVIRYQKTD
ncbi:uncharacterized protein LOC123559187 [Mercenaria mercenaria]|uniref:uncharacterized protein LOC123559187 n=1 Tax=Mercenaria mercenaria TaxID=6596 RepID=UPI00234F6E72|nr:uncharacterized protein LOC123559187 [Mercenaria mercenaria]